MQRTSILGVFLSPFQLEFPITYLIGKYIFFFPFFFFNLEIIATFILKRERVVSMFSIREKKGISHRLCKYIFYAFISDQLSPIRALCARSERVWEPWSSRGEGCWVWAPGPAPWDSALAVPSPLRQDA